MYVAVGDERPMPAAELAALDPAQRQQLALMTREVRAAESTARWSAVAVFAMAAIPLATFLGLWSYLGLKRRR